MSSFLTQYEPLDLIGTGSFGIIRKVRRKSDGVVSRTCCTSLAYVSLNVCVAYCRYSHVKSSSLSACRSATRSSSSQKCACHLHSHHSGRADARVRRNILKDLHHEHIVRYHDRYVDRDAGIMYILMEYCGGGDLSTVIKHAQRHGRPIPEDTIWNYFMQILLALNYCHHPTNHSRLSGGSSGDDEGKERRAQILHRDLKPDNGA